MRQATCSSRAHSLPFLLLLGRSRAGGKLWRLMQTLPRIHNSNSHSNFHLAYSLLVSVCVQSSTDELAQNMRNVGGKNTMTMPYFYGFVSLVGCLKSVSQSLEWVLPLAREGLWKRKATGNCPWCHPCTCSASRWYTGKAPICTPTTQLSPLGHHCWETCWLMPSTAWDLPG